MNTPAHVVLSGLVVGRGRLQAHWGAVTLGALLPDLPMVAFYAYQRLVAGRPERWIWTYGYFDADWQALFDVFNSLPLIAVVALVGWRFARPELVALSASMALHCVCDLALHHDDAHRHFYPLLDWRFASPVSYWDPEHYGRIAASAEALFVLMGAPLLALRREPRAWRFVGVAVLALYVLFAVFAAVMWLGMEPG